MATSEIPIGIKEEEGAELLRLEAQLKKVKAAADWLQKRLWYIRESKKAKKSYDRASKAVGRFSTQILALERYMSAIKQDPGDMDGDIVGGNRQGEFIMNATDFTGRKWSFSFVVSKHICGANKSYEEIRDEGVIELAKHIDAVLLKQYEHLQQKRAASATSVEKWAAILKRDRESKNHPVEQFEGHIGNVMPPVIFGDSLTTAQHWQSLESFLSHPFALPMPSGGLKTFLNSLSGNQE